MPLLSNAPMPTAPERLTWTDHLFRCTSCCRLCRASQESINGHRSDHGLGADVTDAEIARSFDFCLACVDGQHHPGEHVDESQCPECFIHMGDHRMRCSRLDKNNPDAVRRALEVDAYLEARCR